MKAHIKTKYHDGEVEFVVSHYTIVDYFYVTALFLRDPEEDGEPIMTVSTNLQAYNLYPKDMFHIWVKDYSENEGIWDELVGRGYLIPTDNQFANGYVVFKEAKLAGGLEELVKKHYELTE